jgi:hypothetical protein
MAHAGLRLRDVHKFWLGFVFRRSPVVLALNKSNVVKAFAHPAAQAASWVYIAQLRTFSKRQETLDVRLPASAEVTGTRGARQHR